MHRVVLGSRLAAFAGLMLVLVAGLRAQARDEHKNHDGHGSTAGGHSAPKYNVTIHHNGEEVEKKFDLGKSDDHVELAKYFKDGRVVKVELDEPVNLLAISWDLGVYTIVVFLLLLLILKRAAWQPMLEGLKRRESTIRDAFTEAQKARDDARSLHEQYQAEMKKAAENARGIIEEARRDAARLMAEERAKAKAEITTERDRLHRELNLAKDQALHEMWQQSSQLATLIASKAIRRQINADDQRGLLDEALNEMRGAVEERRQFTGGKA